MINFQAVKISIIPLVFAVLLGIASSCTNDKGPAPVITGSLYFHFHSNIDQTEVPGYDTIVVSNQGRKISISMCQFYISDISLVRSDGSLYQVENKVILKIFQNELYFMGDIPVGSYKSVQFNVGFDSITALKNPISADTVFTYPEMWFDNSLPSQKYIYFYFGGKIDTTSSADGNLKQMVNFNYRIGTFPNVQQVKLPEESFLVSNKQLQYIHITINYMKLFEGIDLTKLGNLSVQNISDNSGAVAKSIAKNIPAMFHYEF